MLIKRSPNWSQARQALLASFKFHGVINAGQFADHHTLIWPSVESPFCIVFATNEAPPAKHRFRMLNLELEPTMKKRRQLRIDPGAVFAVAAPDFEELPGGMVVRTKGCELDRQLLLRWHDRLTLTILMELMCLPRGDGLGDYARWIHRHYPEADYLRRVAGTGPQWRAIFLDPMRAIRDQR